jgi:hypothetical protein
MLIDSPYAVYAYPARKWWLNPIGLWDLTHALPLWVPLLGLFRFTRASTGVVLVAGEVTVGFRNFESSRCSVYPQ